jgi:hypothetical protein
MKQVTTFQKQAGVLIFCGLQKMQGEYFEEKWAKSNRLGF